MALLFEIIFQNHDLPSVFPLYGFGMGVRRDEDLAGKVVRLIQIR